MTSPRAQHCPTCGALTREVAELARFSWLGAGDRVAYGCLGCRAESQRVAHELRLGALGALAQW